MIGRDVGGGFDDGVGNSDSIQATNVKTKVVSDLQYPGYLARQHNIIISILQTTFSLTRKGTSGFFFKKKNIA